MPANYNERTLKLAAELREQALRNLGRAAREKNPDARSHDGNGAKGSQSPPH